MDWLLKQTSILLIQIQTMLSNSITMSQASAVVDHSLIVTTLFQALRQATPDDKWDELVDGEMGELLDALCDLEYEVEKS